MTSKYQKKFNDFEQIIQRAGQDVHDELKDQVFLTSSDFSRFLGKKINNSTLKFLVESQQFLKGFEVYYSDDSKMKLWLYDDVVDYFKYNSVPSANQRTIWFNDKYITISQICKLLNVKRGFVSMMIENGNLKRDLVIKNKWVFFNRKSFMLKHFDCWQQLINSKKDYQYETRKQPRRHRKSTAIPNI